MLSTEKAPRTLLSGSTLAICIAQVLEFVGYYLALPLLPVYLRNMGANEFEIGLVVSGFFIGTTVSRPLAGRFANHSRKGPLLFGATLTAAVLTLYPVAANPWVMLVLRLLHGVAVSMFVTAAVAVVADSVSASRRGEALGFFGMSANVSAAIGPAIGLSLVGHIGYVKTFMVGALFGIVALLFTLGLTRRFGADMLPAAPAPQSESARPFRLSMLLAPSMVIAVYGFSYAVTVNFIPLLVNERGIKGGELYFTVYAISIILTRLFTGRIGDRYGRGWMIVPGALVSAIGTVMLATVHSLPILLLAALIYGVGSGSVHPGVLAQMVDLVPPDRRGTAGAAFYMASDMGNAFGGPVIGLLAIQIGLKGAVLIAAIVCASGVGFHFLAPRQTVLHGKDA